MQRKISLQEISEIVAGKSVLLISYESWSKNTHVQRFVDELKDSSSLQHITQSSLILPFTRIEEIKNKLHPEVDFIISLGGGAVIDLAKMTRSPVGGKVPWLGSEPRHIAIPTTVGSGSEATTFATYYDTSKKSYSEEKNLPEYYCHHRAFVESLPHNPLYYSILDGFTQAVESLFSKESTQESIEYSITSLKLYKKSGAFSTDCLDYSSLQEASHYSGKAINIAKTNLVHALSYPLTEHHHIEHGHAVYMNLKGFLKLIEKYSKTFKEIHTRKDLLLKTLSLSSINDFEKFLNFIETQIVIKKNSTLFNQEIFLNYFHSAQQSQRGQNLAIDILKLDSKIILELFYD